MEIVHVIVLLGLLCLRGIETRRTIGLKSFEYSAVSCRKHSKLLSDYGGVGDGKTLNTKAFKAAIDDLSKFASKGGAQLIVPPGKWLTGAFNLTSHFILYIQKDAIILASEDESDYPLVPILPSYEQDRQVGGLRYQSFIFGTNLTDVIITGDNGTIDGQGAIWWKKSRIEKAKHLRPFLIEIMYSNHVQISNLTLLNSPMWFVHPVYSSNILIQGLTILASTDPTAPNTDGIDPDSCSNVRIEDCYIVSGDDCIALKSGIDQYGISVGLPTKHVIIRRVTCHSPHSAVIGLGSEMSGGIQDVRIEDIVAINSESGIRLKTAPGRGGYVKNVYVRNMEMKTMKFIFWMDGKYGSHAHGYNPDTLPTIENINYNNISAEKVTITASLAGIKKKQFKGICISNVKSELSSESRKLQWNCTDVKGISSNVSPNPCCLLRKKHTTCPFPTDRLPIENVKLKKCRFRNN